MSSTSRRHFLKGSLASASALALGIGRDGIAQAAQTRMQAGSQAGAAAQLPRFAPLLRFVDPLPRLRRATPYGKRKDTALYRVPMVECTRKLHSTLPPARLWGFDGQYPGPLFDVMRGQTIEVEWENHLPAEHLFKVDPHIHGAMPPSPAVRTVPHLHGSRTSSYSDGLPEKWFTPGNAVRYTYPNDQQAATLWYHDHALGITRLNVYAGLSGMYLLRDREEQAMNLPAGEYEIPMILQDRTLDDAGQLVYDPTHEDGIPLPPGVWGPEFFGRLPVVNGAVFPYLEVEPRVYRLRILNGANSRFFNLYMNLASRPTDPPKLVTFRQIGSDGGFLPRPVDLTHILLAPAERVDVLVDFSALAGKTITVSNNARAPYPAWGDLVMHADPLAELMQIRVTLPLRAARSFSLPAMPAFHKLDEAATVKTRDFILTERMDGHGHSLGVHINEKGYDDPVTEIVKLGSTEQWRFINTTDDAHPMHLHLIQFQILHRQGFDRGALLGGTVQPVGALRPPPPQEAGWKDTAVVLPGEMLTLLARFDGYTGRYVFHCHMLEHEDNDMMRPYEVIA